MARGHAVVVSGDLAATRARRGWRARGALRAGAGLVTVALHPGMRLWSIAAALTAVMVCPIDTAIEFADMWTDKRLNTCVIGPGAGVGGQHAGFCRGTALSREAKPGAGCGPR